MDINKRTELIKEVGSLGNEEMRIFILEVIRREVSDDKCAALVNFIKYGIRGSRNGIVGGICHQSRSDGQYNGGYTE